MIAAPTLPTFATPLKHPARYTPALLHVIAQYLKPGMLVLDPFGGVGTLNKLAYTGAKIFTGELEFKVCEHSAGLRRVCADAQNLPYTTASLDAIVTSPTYGNRMADDPSNWSPDWQWNTYTSGFGFKLHPSNSGALNWGKKYRGLHAAAYLECWRVLKPSGLMIVNISDHIRDHERVYVSKWTFDTLVDLGFQYRKCHAVKTPRMTFGANHTARTACEYIFVFEKAG